MASVHWMLTLLSFNGICLLLVELCYSFIPDCFSPSLLLLWLPCTWSSTVVVPTINVINLNRLQAKWGKQIYMCACEVTGRLIMCDIIFLYSMNSNLHNCHVGCHDKKTELKKKQWYMKHRLLESSYLPSQFERRHSHSRRSCWYSRSEHIGRLILRL